MSVDTKQKRFAMLNFGRDTDILQPPDGDIDKIDRLMFLGLYVFAAALTQDFFLVFCDSTTAPAFVTDTTETPVFFSQTSETTLSFSAD